MGDRGVAPVVDLAEYRRRAKRGAKIGRGQIRRALPRARAPRLTMLPGYLVAEGTAVRLKELVDGDVVALDGEGRRTWQARLGFVAERAKARRVRRPAPRPEPLGVVAAATDPLDDAA